MINFTSVTSTVNTSPAYNITGGAISESSQTLKTDSANNLGYGLGKIIRVAFDQLYHSWQKMWPQDPSRESLAMRKQVMIYRKGLRECVQKLESALDNVLDNPHDPSYFKRVQALAAHYAFYLQPNETEELRAFQQKALQPIEEKISTLAHPRIRNALRQLLPGVFQGNPAEEARALPLNPMPKRSLQQTNGFPASFDLTTLMGENGFKVEGLVAIDRLGWSVSTAGDLNEDGKADFVLGAYAADPGGRSLAGTAYVLFGQARPTQFDLTTLNGSNGFKIEGLAAGDNLGYSVSTAGDLNGDGKADLVLGAHAAAPGGRARAGTAYVLFGQASGWPAQFDLTTLNGSNGFKIDGLAASDQLGISVSTAGDLNGDGKADLILEANGASPGGRTSAGTAYVLFGQASGWPALFDLTTLNGSNGFKVEGLSLGDQLGRPVSTAGDLNGDGKADLVLGATGADPGGRPNAGTAYVLFGQASGWPSSFDLTTLNGINGFKVDGIAAQDQLGYSGSTAGDLNGDGKADLLLGAKAASPGGRLYAGTAYVLFGQASGWPAQFDLSILNGLNGFKVDGLAAGDNLGISVSTAGDLNGDGNAELVLGAWQAAPGGRLYAGTAYILFGQASGWPAQFDLTTLNGSNGFMVGGDGGDNLGWAVSTAGDLDGDGISDLLLGAPNNGGGKAYIIFGRNTSPPSTPSPSPALAPSSSPSPVWMTPPPRHSPVFSPSPSPMSTPTSSSFALPTIEVKIPSNLNTTFIPLTADIISISNNTATIRLVDSNGYAIVFTGNFSSVPLATSFSPIEVIDGFSIARGNATSDATPVFEGCNFIGQCSLSNATSPLGQVFTTEGVDWKIFVPTVLGILVLIGSGGLIFYFAYYKKRQNGQTAFKKAMPLTDIAVQQDVVAAPQQREAPHQDKHLQIASAYHNSSY